MTIVEQRSAPSAPDELDPGATVRHLAEGIVAAVRKLNRRGAVVAVSGGVDSGVVAALCVRALGPDRVLLLRLPEQQLGGRSSDLGAALARQLGTASEEQPIGPALDALGCYAQQDRAIREVFPDYQRGWRFKLVRSRPTGGATLFSLVVEHPDGMQETRRMPAEAYRLLLSATNAKQRLRTLVTYTWADRLHAAVAGTPNLLEFDQGFFVRGGDGLSDVQPIAHLYKTQVYRLAHYLGLPEGIVSRQPTTETFSLEQSQEEFYFGYPYEQMDLLVWGERHHVPVDDVASRTGLSVAEVEVGYREVARRREATAHLHAPAIRFEPVPGI